MKSARLNLVDVGHCSVRFHALATFLKSAVRRMPPPGPQRLPRIVPNFGLSSWLLRVQDLYAGVICRFGVTTKPLATFDRCSGSSGGPPSATAICGNALTSSGFVSLMPATMESRIVKATCFPSKFAPFSTKSLNSGSDDPPPVATRLIRGHHQQRLWPTLLSSQRSNW